MARRAAVVLVHGILSSADTWSSLKAIVRQDDEIRQAFDFVAYEYWSPRFRVNPMRRIPGYNAVADGLATFLRNETADYDSLVLVTHSQGGLIAQRYIARCIQRGDPDELDRLRALVMLACPNNGSEFLAVLRKAARSFLKNPQEAELQPYAELVIETQRLVIERCVYHQSPDARIPVVAIVGQEDNIVPPSSAYALFPLTESVPGDHNSLLRIDTSTHPTYRTLRRLLLRHAGPRRATPDTGELQRPGRVTWRRQAMVDHQDLFGIEEPLEQLHRHLSGSSGSWVMSIFGNGGAGKTTLAYEAVKRFAEVSDYAAIAWVSAKSSRLTHDGEIEPLRMTQSNLRDLLSQVAAQLELPTGPSALIENEFPRLLRSTFGDERALIVVDNLENVRDADEVVRYLQDSGLLNPHKVLMTTRQSAARLSDAVWEMRWDRLPDDSAKAFARYLAGFDREFSLTVEELDDVLVASGGNPLIIRLLIRLSIDRKQSVADSIAHTRRASRSGTVGLAAYLYDASVSALHERVGPRTAANLLNVFCGVNPVGVDTLFKLSGIADRDEFDRAKACAGQLALLTASNGNTVFSVHSVLREFVCRDRMTEERGG